MLVILKNLTMLWTKSQQVKSSPSTQIFSKAFDKVPHLELLKRSSQIGVGGCIFGDSDFFDQHKHPMLSTPCESVQISRIPGLFENWIVINSVFEKEISWLKSALRKKHASYLKFWKKFLCESVQICTDPCRYPRICYKLTIPINYYNVFQVSSNY